MCRVLRSRRKESQRSVVVRPGRRRCGISRISAPGRRAALALLVHTLHTSLPLPADDSPEARAHRDNAAIAEVASLLPVNAEEAAIAARCVAANAYAMDCLRLARLHPDDSRHVLRCNAQSASMMRQARAFRTALDRAQTARRKREAAPDADAAGPQMPAPVADAPAQAPSPQSPRPNPIAEAERYALQHRKRAVLIRRLGHLPPKFGWLAPESKLASRGVG